MLLTSVSILYINPLILICRYGLASGFCTQKLLNWKLLHAVSSMNAILHHETHFSKSSPFTTSNTNITAVHIARNLNSCWAYKFKKYYPRFLFKSLLGFNTACACGNGCSIVNDMAWILERHETGFWFSSYAVVWLFYSTVNVTCGHRKEIW
jgi:hypothetical protein